MALQTNKPLLPTESETDPVVELSKKMQKQEMGTGTEGEGKGTRCSTWNTFVGEAKQYREHCKNDWHKHNLKRKTHKLPPLTAEECVAEIDMDDSKADLKDYFFWNLQIFKFSAVFVVRLMLNANIL